MHTGKVWKVYLQLGNTSGWVYGQPVPAETYLSVSNAQSINATPGVNYTESNQENVACSVVGNNFFQQSAAETVSIHKSAYVFASEIPLGVCNCSQTCNGLCSVQGFETNKANGACYTAPNNYRQCYDLVLNGNDCFVRRILCFGQSSAGSCN